MKSKLFITTAGGYVFTFKILAIETKGGGGSRRRVQRGGLCNKYKVQYSWAELRSSDTWLSRLCKLVFNAAAVPAYK